MRAPRDGVVVRPDESGTSPSGTRYVLTRPWLGASVPFTLTATDTQ